MRAITDDDRDGVTAACSDAIADEHGHSDAPAESVNELKEKAVAYYTEFARMDAVACGGSADDAELHHKRTRERVKVRLMKDRKDQSCGFGILAFAMFLSYLITIFKAIWDWRNSQ